MKVVVAGEGAFGRKHLAALANIDGIEAVSLAGGVEQTTERVYPRLDAQLKAKGL